MHPARQVAQNGESGLAVLSIWLHQADIYTESSSSLLNPQFFEKMGRACMFVLYLTIIRNAFFK